MKDEDKSQKETFIFKDDFKWLSDNVDKIENINFMTKYGGYSINDNGENERFVCVSISFINGPSKDGEKKVHWAIRESEFLEMLIQMFKTGYLPYDIFKAQILKD